MMKKIFELMLIGGSMVFMVMAVMMLFIDFTKLEIAIPLIVMFVGYLGDEYCTNQMKIKRQRGYR